MTFKTKDFVAPVYDIEKLTFSFPDAEGYVHVTAPAGTLAPGSTILIINSTNGFVATFTADNDGAVGLLVPAVLPATTSDRLFVTITDPQGNVTTFERSQYENPATGETAIGPGGGTVKGAGGVELRLPSGAVRRGCGSRSRSPRRRRSRRRSPRSSSRSCSRGRRSGRC